MSFENSICDDYVTEKFYRRGLNHNLIPVVMNGADMEKIAPPHSYIDVRDFRSPRVRSLFNLSNQTKKHGIICELKI